MDNATMIAALESIGITGGNLDSWIINDKIATINLTNDGSHSYNQFEQRLYFDTTNDIIKTKYYNTEAISTRFYSISRASSSTYTVGTNSYGRYGLMNKVFPYHGQPKVGDVLFTISPATLELVDQAIITSVSYNTITTDSDVSLSGGVIACYADKKFVETPPDNFYLFVLEDESIVFYSEPKTSFVTDIYIGFSDVTGFSLITDSRLQKQFY
jgi:hypothetical protein